MTSIEKSKKGLKSYYLGKIEEKQILLRDKMENLRRLQTQRNELNSRGKN